MTKSKRPLIIAILGLTLLLFLSQSIQNSLVFNRINIENGQWWRILTGNLTHSNFSHLLLNVSGLWILGFLFIDSLKAKTFIFSSLFLSAVVGMGLYYFNPELQKYYGFSGILYGLFFIAAICSIRQRDYFTGLSVATLIPGKVIWDFFYGGSASSEQLIGIPVATDAHLFGLVGALFIAVFVYFQHINSNHKRHPPTF